ncbi:MAG: extracellular solute-binding protein [Patescibacteria group bacterium]
MKSVSAFQIIVITVFVVLTIAGVGVFAAFGGISGGTSVGAVTIWGTQDAQAIDGVLQTLRTNDKSFQEVTYVQADPVKYQASLVNAIASGRSPDLFMMSVEQMGVFADKIITVPYNKVSQSTYTNSYIDEANVFLNSAGAWALPFTVDPLVMYFNRDLLSSAGVSTAPRYWNELLSLAPKITSLDSSQNVRRSAVALGTWSNVNNAKAILSSLFMQAGDPIVGRDEQGNLASVFGSAPPGAAENPAQSALRFYTEFANPSKTSYSWNRSLPTSVQAFVGGDLAIYFGFASELGTIAKQNPNLHFGVALLPQLQGSSVQVTYGLLTGLAIPRSARNPQGALVIAQKLSSQAAAQALAVSTGLPPVRRDVALDTSANAAAQVFVQSGLIARGWFDPNQGATDGIFKAMIESVTTGKSDPAQAVSDAAQAFTALFQ